MNQHRIEKIAIVGGGVAAWASAACISDALRGQLIEIKVIDGHADQVTGIEATLPITQAFNQRLGINEQSLMRETAASFSLGTQFNDWLAPGLSYFQPMAAHGASIEFVMFHQYAIKARLKGDETPFNQYSLCAMAALKDKFAHPAMDPESILSTLLYAHHLDAQRYVKFLRDYAMSNGVGELEANLTDLQIDPENGFITSISLNSGESLIADLFIDCSGHAAELSGQLPDASYEDWSHLLPANRMVSACGEVLDTRPCSSISALDSGWYQCLATQHIQEHRLIYCDRHLEDSDALAVLRKTVGNNGLSEPVIRSFVAGHRSNAWTGNCISIGSSAGAFEPIAGTSLALIQSGLIRLVSMFPDKDCNSLLADEFNRLSKGEHENIRDFLILQYRASKRGDSPFWKDYLAHEVPSSLAHKIELFRAQGQVAFYEQESLPDANWASVWLGQDQWPQAYDPMLDNYDFNRLVDRFNQMKQLISEAVEAMPPHAEFLHQFCPATP